MNFHRSNTDVQHIRDFTIRVPDRDQAKDVTLSGCQLVERYGLIDKRFTFSSQHGGCPFHRGVSAEQLGGVRSITNIMLVKLIGMKNELCAARLLWHSAVDEGPAGRTDLCTCEGSGKRTLHADFCMRTIRSPFLFPAFPKEQTTRVLHLSTQS